MSVLGRKIDKYLVIQQLKFNLSQKSKSDNYNNYRF